MNYIKNTIVIALVVVGILLCLYGIVYLTIALVTGLTVPFIKGMSALIVGLLNGAIGLRLDKED